MGYKPNYERSNGRADRRKRIDFAAGLSVYDETERNKATAEERRKDGENRSLINRRIRELKELVGSGENAEEKVLEMIKSEFPNSKYSGYFKSWVENAFKKKGNTPFRKIIKGEVEETR